MRRIVFLFVIGLGGAAILISLGVWQVQRLAWKQDLLNRIQTQIEGPSQPMNVAIAGTDLQRYAAVEATGTFGRGYLRILASRKSIGPVYRIVRPFEVDGTGRILVDTGWIRDGASVPEVPVNSIRIEGNIDQPNEIDGFTPEPDLAANIWFARDVAAMAEALETRPVLIVLRNAPETDIGVTPWPVDTAGIPNDHLQYAITWFSLAAIWVAMSLYFTLRSMRKPAKTV